MCPPRVLGALKSPGSIGLRCYDTLECIKKFSSEFAETPQICSTISVDGKTKEKLGQSRLDFSKFTEQKNVHFVLKI